MCLKRGFLIDNLEVSILLLFSYLSHKLFTEFIYFTDTGGECLHLEWFCWLAASTKDTVDVGKN